MQNNDKQIDSQKSSWISLDAIQKLSLALLPAALAVMGYSFFEIQRVLKGVEDMSLKGSDIDNFSAKLKRELAAFHTVGNIITRSSQGDQILDEVGRKNASSVTSRDIENWRSKIILRQMELKRDQGTLQQYDAQAYPYMHTLTISANNLITQEDAMWVSLQHFLDKLQDKSAKPGERDRVLQHFLDDMSKFRAAIHACQGGLDAVSDRQHDLEDEDSLERERIIIVVNSYNRSLLVSLILLAFSGIAISLLICGVLGFWKRKKQPSLIVPP